MSNDVTANQQAAGFQDDEIDLLQLVGTLWDGKWLIGLIAFLSMLLGGAYAYFSTPIYRSNILVQVEDNKSALGGLDELTDFMGGDAASVTEIEVLRSRHVVGQVVDAKNLTISVAPKMPPLIGAINNKLNSPRLEQAKPWEPLLSVQRFDVPAAFEGQVFNLQLRDNNQYDLAIGGVNVGSGVINGQFKPAEFGAANSIDIFIATAAAKPGTEFNLVKKRWAQAVANLQSGLSISEKGKKTGVIEVAYEGKNPVEIQDLLNTLGNVYVRQNVERKSEEAEKSLEFLDKQLPKLRGQLDAAEIAMNDFMQQQQSVDLTAEAQSIVQQLVEIEQQQSALELKKSELEQKYGSRHPSMLVLIDQNKRLNGQKQKLENLISDLPDAQQQALRLARDVEVNGALYTYLLNKAQELRVIKAGTVGNVRILDSAVLPYQAVKPKKPLIVALSLVLGGFIGVGLVLLRRALNRGVQDPSQLETKLGLPIYATIPFSQNEAALGRKKGKKHPILAQEDGKDLAVEALRSLRTSLHFAMMDAENNRIAISGPSPGIGKSFVSVNLAWLLAESGKKVLLIDADMRKGHIHEYFGLPRDGGLSDLIAEEATAEQASHNISAQPNLTVITTGKIPPNPSELLMSELFTKQLEAMGQQYDIVIVDTPPIMAVADAGIITPLVGATFMVARAGVNSVAEVEEANKRLVKDGGKVSGILFNGMNRKAGAYKYGAYKYYQYEYK